MERKLKVWKVSYYWNGGWGAYQTYEYVCVAENETQAIELAISDSGEKDRTNWYATEINVDKAEAHQINQQCN